MASRVQESQTTASLVMRLIVSLILPLWGLIILALGIRHLYLWWILTGGAILVVGAISFIGTPFVDFHVGER